MNRAEQAISTLLDYVQRSTHWEEGGATRHDALMALGVLGADVAAPYRPKPCSEEEPEHPPSMLLQLALQRVDFIADTDMIEVSDETARRKGNPYAKRKINMADAKHCAKFAAKHLRDAWDGLEWVEKGLAEWRGVAQENSRHAEAARATGRVAINHLQEVLNKARTHDEQQRADTAARDWLLSIGSEPG